ncbi:anti-sigma factor [Cellulomonas iranensis]|uniref:Regulator of SigK n=3 Tax=Cellulomonas iranensis TaxID=76862 RepID=A0ABU0GNC1_9CELL|nr:anti-sigma factor [Cellulomonas iranensis]MDQ0426857.1 hypothetical protein [Cellulomonas iranensis]
MSERPTDDATRDLLGAWALDAVSDDERAAVEALLARDPDAAREARELRAVAATLAAATARPAPEHVRAATLAAVAATPQVGTGAAAAGAVDLASERVRRRRAPVRTALVAAVAAAVLAVPVTVAWRQADRAAVAEQRLAAVERLLGAPDARLVAADVAGGGRAVAVVTDDVALVTASGVSDPGSDRVYQLWLLRDGAALPSSTSPVTAGGFDVTTAEFRPGDALAVTVEPRGGSTAPTTDPVVVLEPA